ncbi:hypothetical protein P7K49_027266 [Saguinus oedipus]|uniref:Uncharacterized protein n=1 Tax=Saguinus oedipus TaxID=9490 RepID=A0ABQ9U8Z9_SAGOE|nr:hypothetical protein P7K49_027266 [Saguinus oedipus]
MEPDTGLAAQGWPLLLPTHAPGIDTGSQLASAQRFRCVAADRILPEASDLRNSLHCGFYYRILTGRNRYQRCAVDGACQDCNRVSICVDKKGRQKDSMGGSTQDAAF